MNEEKIEEIFSILENLDYLDQIDTLKETLSQLISNYYYEDID